MRWLYIYDSITVFFIIIEKRDFTNIFFLVFKNNGIDFNYKYITISNIII